MRNSIEIDIKNREIKVDERSFRIPALVSFNEKLETELRFQFDISKRHKKLIDHVLDFDVDTPFLWVDRCSAIKKYSGQSEGKGFCLMAGKRGNGQLDSIKIDDYIKITAGEIHHLLSN